MVGGSDPSGRPAGVKMEGKDRISLVLERKRRPGVQAAGPRADGDGMDTSTLVLERGAGRTGERLAGEIAWRMDREGRIMVGRGGMVEVWASGRVCAEAMIGVVETVGGRAAVLGLVPRGLVDVLAARFPEVRWAVADVVPSVTMR